VRACYLRNHDPATQFANPDRQKANLATQFTNPDSEKANPVTLFANPTTWSRCARDLDERSGDDRLRCLRSDFC
jgi:hypothetical protein